MNFRAWLNESYNTWTAKLQDNLWVHCSDYDYVQINYTTLHCDPLGVYLFPNVKAITDEFKNRKYRFYVQVPSDLKVLDLSLLDADDLLDLGEKVGMPNNYLNDISDKVGEDPMNFGAKGDIWRGITDYFCDTTQGRVGTGQAKFNARLRAMGYDAIFDDSDTIYENEVQLVVLNPRKLKVVRRERAGRIRSGYQETVEIMQSVAKHLNSFGKVELKLPRASSSGVGNLKTNLEGFLRVGDITWRFTTQPLYNNNDPVKVLAMSTGGHYVDPILFDLSKPVLFQHNLETIQYLTKLANQQQAVGV